MPSVILNDTERLRSSQGESCLFREIGNSCSPSLLRGGQVAPMKPIKWYGSHGSTFGPIDVVMGQQLPSRRYQSCPAALTQQRQLCSSVVDDDTASSTAIIAPAPPFAQSSPASRRRKLFGEGALPTAQLAAQLCVQACPLSPFC